MIRTTLRLFSVSRRAAVAEAAKPDSAPPDLGTSVLPGPEMELASSARPDPPQPDSSQPSLARPGPARNETLVVELPSGTTIGQALGDLGIFHEAEVSLLVGGRIVEWSYLLRDGDEVAVVPPLVGGEH